MGMLFHDDECTSPVKCTIYSTAMVILMKIPYYVSFVVSVPLRVIFYGVNLGWQGADEYWRDITTHIAASREGLTVEQFIDKQRKEFEQQREDAMREQMEKVARYAIPVMMGKKQDKE